MSLPSWPEPFDKTKQTLAAYIGNVDEINYERAMKEAYAARLRAVVALLDKCGCIPRENHACPGCRALAAIGEVPQG